MTGVGRGLGRAIAENVLAEGGIVYGTSRDQKTAIAIANRYKTVPIVTDMRDTVSPQLMGSSA
ncbi:hypothetical protein [Arthrobacter sp. efr-133-TYG-104]|uniref:hypothetical protein n=1 Tax=Arthrobacter sp. efr-133-TYG-104 TaxID=3040324 RepID=UPI003305D2C5